MKAVTYHLHWIMHIIVYPKGRYMVSEQLHLYQYIAQQTFVLIRFPFFLLDIRNNE